MGLLLTISTIRGEMTLGWMSWICKTCLLYSSVIVLISVRQASTLGYNMLEKQMNDPWLCSERSFTSGMWITWEPTELFTHCFSGPVLVESILVFSVSARFSWILSITLRCCTPGRSDGVKQTVWIQTDPVDDLSLTGGTSSYLGKIGTWLAWERTPPPPGRGSAVCGEIWEEVPERAAENRLQNTRGMVSHGCSSFLLFKHIITIFLF